MIASLDEFHVPRNLLTEGRGLEDELELLYLHGVHETSLGKSFTGSFLNVFETIEVSELFLLSSLDETSYRSLLLR
jgi:hypothetical protein